MFKVGWGKALQLNACYILVHLLSCHTPALTNNNKVSTLGQCCLNVAQLVFKVGSI